MTNESKKLAFLGLGVMGYPMAGHLARAGHEVTVYNRSPAKADAWRNEYRGRTARTPAEAARSAEIVLMCVGNDDDVRTVANGAEGALAGMAAGTILVDHTTASAEVAREVHAAAAARGVGSQVHYIPVHTQPCCEAGSTLWATVNPMLERPPCSSLSQRRLPLPAELR